MPKSISKHLAKDQLATLDPDITDVTFNSMFSVEDIKLAISQTECIYLNEQDLLILLEFLRKEKLKCH